jgi:lycopene beta-cyclase
MCKLELSFWANQPTPFDKIACRSWNRITFASDNFEKQLPLEDYTYKTIRGLDFYRSVQEELAAHSNIEFLQERVDQIIDDYMGAYILAGEQYFWGQWVFDSRLKTGELKHRPVFGKQVLRQHFVGWMIETAEDAFDPESPILFDFRVPQDQDMRFFYVLPFSKREALVEYVGLKHVEFDHLMQNYVEGVLNLKNYRVSPLEGGVIVLTDHEFKRKAGKHILRIGSAGGMVKPSSGYAFTRILKDSDAIIDSLLNYGHPFHLPPVNFFYRFLDSQMLEVMSRFSSKMKKIFTAMFKYNPAPRIFRLLDETSSIREILALILTMRFKSLFIWTVVTDEKLPTSQEAA